MVLVLFVVMLLCPLVALAQQSPPPADCQAQLAQALLREGSAQSLAGQSREALISYFQTEMRKLIDERDTARKELTELKNGAGKESK